MAELLSRLSVQFRVQNMLTRWQEMSGMRNLIVHQYDQVDFDLIWDVVQTNLPVLQVQIEALIDQQKITFICYRQFF